MTIGQKIKSRRLELNMSQDELAKKCGYKSRSSINKIEMSRDLPLKKVKIMATALDLSVSYLMGWDDEKLEKEFEYHQMLQADYADISLEALKFAQDWDSLDEESKRQLVLMLAFLKDQNKK